MTAQRKRSPETWARVEADFRSGLTYREVCARYDVGLTALKTRASREGWRRCDQPDPAPVFDDDTPLVPAADIADMAHRRAAEAVRAGHAVDAERWTRLQRTWSRRFAREFRDLTPGELETVPEERRVLSMEELDIRRALFINSVRGFRELDALVDKRAKPPEPATPPNLEPAKAAPPPPPPAEPEPLPAKDLAPPPPPEPAKSATPAPPDPDDRLSPEDRAYIERLGALLALARRRGDCATEADTVARIARIRARAAPPPSVPPPAGLEDAL